MGRLVEPRVDAAATSRPRPTAKARGRAAERVVDGLRLARAATTCKAEGLGRTARLARRPASRRGSGARRHRRSRRCAGRRLWGQSVSPPPPVSRPGLVSRPAAAFGRRRGGWQGGEHGGEALARGWTAASAVGGPGYGAARSLPGALKAAAVRTTRCANSKPAVAVLGGPHGWGTVVGSRMCG